MAKETRRARGASIGAAVTPGTPNLSEAPGGLRRFFRFSQLAVGEAGAGRKIEDIWATLLRELEDAGVPAEARSRLESLGAKNVLNRGTRLHESVAKLAGNKENVQIIKETVGAARSATRGIPAATLEAEIQSAFKILEKDGTSEVKEIMKELRAAHKANPSLLPRVGANQQLSALASRGDDPFVARMYNKMLKKTPAARLPEGIVETLKQATGGKLPKVAAATRAGLTEAGVKGVSAGASAARTGLGFLGKSALGTAGIGIVAALEIGRAKKIIGREGRAKEAALQGFQEVGASSSVDFLRDTVRQQEALARRKMVMQQFEPDLFHEVIRVLSDTGQSKETLTSSERRIGSDARLPASGFRRGGREPADVEFLLDQLFAQMGG